MYLIKYLNDETLRCYLFKMLPIKKVYYCNTRMFCIVAKNLQNVLQKILEFSFHGLFIQMLLSEFFLKII